MHKRNWLAKNIKCKSIIRDIFYLKFCNEFLQNLFEGIRNICPSGLEFLLNIASQSDFGERRPKILKQNLT